MTADGPADLSGLKIDRDAPPPETGRLRRVLLWGAVTVLALGGAVLAYRAANPASVPVAVARAEPLGGVPGAGATEILTANGYVVARQRASVSTEVAGRLNQLFVEEGSRVRKGQVLGVLQNADQKSALASAHAALASAEAREAEAAANARETSLARGRAQQLHAKGLVSQAELDQAVASDDVARARVKSAEAEVGEIVSPIPSSGGLTRGAIVTMANLATLEVEADVNEGYVSRVHEGMRAEITLDAYPDERFPGHVRQIVPTADRQKATVLVKVAFDRLDARVLPEMGIKTSFLADSPATGSAAGTTAVAAAVAIPKRAVREADGRAVVYVVEGGRAVMRGVSPRPLAGDRVAVSAGLAPGELVIVEAPSTLGDKSRVRVK